MTTNQKSIQLPFTNSDHSHVTVVIPANNSGKFLPAAIESALSQTDPDVEIVVDDDSTDDTNLIGNRYQGGNISSASAKMLIGTFAVQYLEQGYIPQHGSSAEKIAYPTTAKLAADLHGAHQHQLSQVSTNNQLKNRAEQQQAANALRRR